MIGQVIEVADKVLGKFIPDKNLKMKLQKEMTMAFHDANLAQIQLNKQEAAPRQSMNNENANTTQIIPLGRT